MKKAAAFLLLTVICLLSAGCKSAPPPSDAGDESISFTDDLGRKVTVNRIDRVASLLGSYTDLWMLAGGTVCASADDAWEDLKLPLPEDAVNLGSAHRPNKELLLASNPDFVIASAKLSRQVELKDPLEAAGIPVAFFDVSDFTSYLRVLKILTDLTGNTQRYDQYGTAQQTAIRNLLDRRQGEPPQTVLVLRASASSIRAKNSKSTMLGGMLSDFGCINIADSDSMLLDHLNIESILQQNPDKIFFVETGDDSQGIRRSIEQLFAENPLWKELSAVKNKQVFLMEKQLFNLKPNARFSEAYEKLDAILYGTPNEA